MKYFSTSFENGCNIMRSSLDYSIRFPEDDILVGPKHFLEIKYLILSFSISFIYSEKEQPYTLII